MIGLIITMCIADLVKELLLKEREELLKESNKNRPE
jgi:hypothetical protein